MSKGLYPICFGQTCRYRSWGNDVLRNYFEIPSADRQPGEMFLMLDGSGESSEITNGELAGKNLSDLAKMGMDYLGRRRNGRNGFPLIVKYMATGNALPLQVHPAEETTRVEKNLTPNSKAWYIIEGDAGSKLHAELKSEFTKQQLLSRIGNESLYDLTNEFHPVRGDCYYLPSGRIHGLGPGNVVLSIEQVGGTTFALDEAGEGEDPNATFISAAEARGYINFKDRTMPRIIRDETKDDKRNRKLPLITTNPAFSVEELRLVTKMNHRAGGDSFHILVSLDAAVEVTYSGGSVELKPHQACFIPAKLGFYNTVPKGPTRVIRVC